MQQQKSIYNLIERFDKDYRCGPFRDKHGSCLTRGERFNLCTEHLVNNNNYHQNFLEETKCDERINKYDLLQLRYIFTKYPQLALYQYTHYKYIYPPISDEA